MPATMQPSKRLKALQDDKASALQRMEHILNEVDKADGKWSTDQEKDYEQLEASLPGLDKQIEREQKFLEAQRSMEPVRNRNADTPAEASARDGVGKIKDNWQDDPMCGYGKPRDFLLDVIEGSRGGEISAQLRFLAAAGSDEQGGYSDPHGGFFIPEGMSPQLLSVGMEADPTMARVTQVPMTDSIVKFNARVDKNHTSSVSGGLTVGRRAETQAASASRQEYEQVELKATSQFGVSYVTEELLERSMVSFVAIIEQGFRDEFASQGLRERIRGTGAGEPLGVLNAACRIDVAKESMQAADTINGTNLVKMRARIWNYQRAIWIANQDTFVQLVAAHISGTNTDQYLFTPGNGTDVPDTLFGRPIFFSEYASTLGDLGDIMLCDWSQYLWGMYGSRNPRRAESIHVRFLNHERTFKFWIENDGQPWWRSALTPKQSATTLSPFVALAERA